MRKGTYYEGAAAAAQPKKILILGESHHGDKPEDVGKPVEEGDTERVVRVYLSQEGKRDARLQFFDKIAQCFGIDSEKNEERRQFWEKVFFANYVDVLCGVGDGDDAAETKVREHGKEYAKKVAELVDTYRIDVIFCFSILSYWSLWAHFVSGSCREGVFPDGQGSFLNQKVVGRRSGRNVYLRGYICQPMPGLFDRPVTIYGIPHPSGRNGFDPEHFVKDLKPVFEDRCG
ncbi:MAG: hypothetical protein K2O45_13030 [Oscillospiraceae bacterium]|nr:hypothetical protein [Oscillospiraceae bacterium]